MKKKNGGGKERKDDTHIVTVVIMAIDRDCEGEKKETNVLKILQK